MFNIENLITPKLQEQLDSFEHTKTKAVFLLRILDYENYLPYHAYDIGKLWLDRTGTRFIPEKYAKINEDKDFILKFANRTDDIERTKKLINKLCDDIDNGGKNHESIIIGASGSMLVVDNLDDFTFVGPDGVTEPKPPKPQKRTLAEVLAMGKMLAERNRKR